MSKLFTTAITDKLQTLQEVKSLMLFRVTVFSSVFAVPLLILNIYFSFKFQIDVWGIIHSLALLPVLIVLLFFNKIPYKIKANLVIDSYQLVGIVNFFIGGFTGAGIMFFLAVVGLSVLFLNYRQAVFRISFSAIIMIIFAVLFSTKQLHIYINVYESNSSLISWAVAISLFLLLCIMFLLTYTVIEKQLQQKLKVSLQQQKELEEYNIKLKELLQLQEQHKKELLEAKLKAEESNKLKTEFLHNMSHEIRTPLNGIMGFSKLLKKPNLSKEKVDQFSEIIVQSGTKLQKVIDDILEISVLETKQIRVKTEQLDLFEFLNELYLVFLVNPKKGVELKLNCNDKTIVLNQDLLKLHKIINNLIENSIKFTNSGYVEFGCLDNNDETVLLYVKDTGIGISDENKLRIFERFTQESLETSTKFGGLGLGLCIAKENVELLKGKIWLESEKDKGTCFYVEIPKDLKA